MYSLDRRQREVDKDTGLNRNHKDQRQTIIFKCKQKDDGHKHCCQDRDDHIILRKRFAQIIVTGGISYYIHFMVIFLRNISYLVDRCKGLLSFHRSGDCKQHAMVVISLQLFSRIRQGLVHIFDIL